MDDCGIVETTPVSRNLCLESHDCFASASLCDTAGPLDFTELQLCHF